MAPYLLMSHRFKVIQRKCFVEFPVLENLCCRPMLIGYMRKKYGETNGLHVAVSLLYNLRNVFIDWTPKIQQFVTWLESYCRLYMKYILCDLELRTFQ